MKNPKFSYIHHNGDDFILFLLYPSSLMDGFAALERSILNFHFFCLPFANDYRLLAPNSIIKRIHMIQSKRHSYRFSSEWVKKTQSVFSFRDFSRLKWNCVFILLLKKKKLDLWEIFFFCAIVCTRFWWKQWYGWDFM